MKVEKQQALKLNAVQLRGVIDDIHQRWMPDGSLAVVASLNIHRPHLGQQRVTMCEEQPMPLRAEGMFAESIIKLKGKSVHIEGELRRRYYSRDGEQRWGQVEIWVNRVDLLEF
ncbi:MAG: hypothetical protein R8M45_06440 [Ghiorsea sp.]